jgi:hypothetical protein
MKYLAVGAAVVGLIFGVLFAFGPFVLGTPTGSAAPFIMPVLFAVIIVRTHFLNLRRLRDTSAAPPRWRLLTYNLLLLGLLALSISMMYEMDARFRQMPTAMAVYLALGVASFGVSALYLSLPNARRFAATSQ